MSGLQHIEQTVKHAFISGEPGTTGREPFEDNTPLDHAVSGGHSLPTHAHAGTAGGRDVIPDSSLNSTGTRGTHGTHGTHGDHSSSGLGSGAGHTPMSSGVASSVGAGLGQHNNGLTGNEDRHRSDHTAHPHTTDYGLGANKDHSSKDNRGLVEKVKDALPGGHNSNTTHATTHNTHNTVPTDTNASNNRGIVDKINDALPGTPAKTTQAYNSTSNSSTLGSSTHNDHSGLSSSTHNQSGLSSSTHGTSGHHDQGVAGLAGAGAGVGSGLGHNSNNLSDRETGVTGTAYGAGKHGTDHTSSSHTGTGLTGAGVGSGLGSSHHDSTHKSHTPMSSGVGASVGHGMANQDPNAHERDQRDEDKKAGVLDKVMGTSGSDFTTRDRKGEGAYADTDGHFELNSSGPKGNTALTGREGDLSKNPVAQSQSHATGTHPTSSTSTGAHNTTTGAHDPNAPKEGLLAKAKHAVGL